MCYGPLWFRGVSLRWTCGSVVGTIPREFPQTERTGQTGRGGVPGTLMSGFRMGDQYFARKSSGVA